MNKIFTIAKKEFLDIFRDKRTLVRMILIPLIAFPVIIQLITTLQESQSKKQAEEVLKVGYFLNGQDEAIINRMKVDSLYEFIPYDDTVALASDVDTKEINLGIGLNSNYDIALASGKQGKFSMFIRGADKEDYERFENLLEQEKVFITNNRLEDLGKESLFIEPLLIYENDQSELQEILAKYAGGILPYIFMAFLFMGAMLPAIDLFAGEKERGTIETLLTSPVNRLQILLGKMVVVVAFGLLSALVALVGLFASMNLLDGNSELMEAMNAMLTPQLFVMLFILLIPLAIFFAGVMIPISVYAKSFKEAQSILTPLNIVMVLPAMVGFVPGVELDYTTAFIPVVNVVLSTKMLLSGNIDFVLLTITFLTLILLAAVSVYISMRQFGKESSILR
jgi:sodium transport system permease protein